MSRNQRDLRKSVLVAALVLLTVAVSGCGGGGSSGGGGPSPSCTDAVVMNHAESAVLGFPDGGTPPANSTVSLPATIDSVGDLVVVSAWCFPPDFSGNGCTSVGVTLGSQTATRTSVETNLDVGTSGSPGSGKGWIYYVLSASTAGSVTITFTTVETQQLQISYLDAKPSAGCVFSHDIDSALGTGDGNPSMTSPSYSPAAGDFLYNFTITDTHMVDPVGSPWSSLLWNEAGQNSHFLANSVNLIAYNSSAPGGSVFNNSNTLHPGLDSLQALLTSFKMTQLVANQRLKPMSESSRRQDQAPGREKSFSRVMVLSFR